MKKKGNIQKRGDRISKRKIGLNPKMQGRWAGIFEEIKAEMNKLPDVRLDKIKRIKKAIDSGNYRIDSYKLAARIIEEI